MIDYKKALDSWSQMKKDKPLGERSITEAISQAIVPPGYQDTGDAAKNQRDMEYFQKKQARDNLYTHTRNNIDEIDNGDILESRPLFGEDGGISLMEVLYKGVPGVHYIAPGDEGSRMEKYTIGDSKTRFAGSETPKND